MTTDEQIKANYTKILESIILTSAASNVPQPKLIVVTKKQPIEVIDVLVRSGCKAFGENYPEEAIEKIRGINNQNIQWHMIGHIQSRKTALISEYFNYVHSIDRFKVANKLDQKLNGIKMPVLLEINISGEQSKNGLPAWESSKWADLLMVIQEIVNLPNILVCGLMTMPPYDKNPENSRRHFIKLRHLMEYINSQLNLSFNELSMGTSFDYHVAIQEGATFLRVGTAITGERK